MDLLDWGRRVHGDIKVVGTLNLFHFVTHRLAIEADEANLKFLWDLNLWNAADLLRSRSKFIKINSFQLDKSLRGKTKLLRVQEEDKSAAEKKVN